MRMKMPLGIRPTQDKVKQALFNMIGDKIIDADFLELYAGSGKIGIEALKRGAKSVTFVESSPKCMKVLKENVSKVFPDHGLFPIHYSLLSVDRAILRLTEQGKKFDIIFMDPPYYKEEAKNSLIILDNYDIYTDTSHIYVEHFKKDILPNQLKSLNLCKVKAYGDTFLTLYLKK